MPNNDGIWNIREYGAAADGKRVDTRSFQRAIDACHAAGGGTVYVPPGEYIAGLLRFRSHVTLYLAPGAVVHASPHRVDYVEDDEDPGESAYWLVADDQADIAIIGGGTLVGIGADELGRRPGDVYREQKPPFRLGTLWFRHCHDLTFRDITIRDSDLWTLRLYRCERVTIDGVDILNEFYHTNSDGIDPVSCRDVHISNCHITAGDDCICPKAEDGYPCENVVVTNCTLESVATAVKLGTGSQGDFRNIHVSNCTIRNSTVGIGIFVKDGGTVERVTFANLSISTLDEPREAVEYLQQEIYPLFLDIERRYGEESPVGAVRDLTFRDIHIYSDNGILIQGMAQSPVENLTLQNITQRVERGYAYADREKHRGGTSDPNDDRITVYARQPSYCTLANVNGLLLSDLRLIVAPDVQQEYDRAALSLHHVTGGTVRNVQRDAGSAEGAGEAPVIAMEDCRRMLVSGCLAAPDTSRFLVVRGAESEAITVLGNALGDGYEPIVREEGVPPGAVTTSATG